MERWIIVSEFLAALAIVVVFFSMNSKIERLQYVNTKLVAEIVLLHNDLHPNETIEPFVLIPE